MTSISIRAVDLRKNGYIVEVKDSVLYANYKNSINELNLYNLSKDKFLFMTRDEVNANVSADSHLRYLYYVALNLFIYLILKSIIIYRNFLSLYVPLL